VQLTLIKGLLAWNPRIESLKWAT